MTHKHWFEDLSEEDLAFIKRFILASGSLKEVAGEYGISYPTIRLRLDRLIEKIKILDSLEIQSDFERLLRARFADGRVDGESFRMLLEAYKKEKEEGHENPSAGR